MLIWMILFLVGIGLTILGLLWIITGLAKKNWRKALLGILMPTLFWSAFALLLEADHRFIEEETRKNGGQPPDWVW